MDAFVSRKRKWAEEPPTPVASTVTPTSDSAEQEEESTDFKLALLASLHSELEKDTLLEALLAADGSVEQASQCLSQSRPVNPRKRPAPSTVGYQSSLSSYRIAPADGQFAKKPLVKKGKTLFLYSPEDIEANTPCSIIHNFLPVEQADALLVRLLEASESYDRYEFKLFDRVVLSPHTYSFYVNSLEEAERQKTEYIYNGGQIEVRTLTSDYIKILMPVRMSGRVYRRCSTRAHKWKKLSTARYNGEYAIFTPTARNSSTNHPIHGEPTLLSSIVTMGHRRA
jgi:hypothetical protein